MTIPFPFKEILSPPFHMKISYTLEQVINYLGTWSAVKNYRKTVGRDPLFGLTHKLQGHWKDSQSPKDVQTPIYLRLGIIK